MCVTIIIDQDDPTVCNYAIVQTKQKVEVEFVCIIEIAFMLFIFIVKSFGFPSEKVTPIGKFNGTRNNVAKCFLTRLNGTVFQS